jgi:superfamily II DNA or RNA helicase
MSIPLTERLLSDAGGWQALKAAKAIHAAGRVSAARYEPPILTGLVKEGLTQYKSGLRIGSRIDIENLCTCRQARSRGTICPHALAVGLEVLRPTPAQPAAPAPAPATASAPPPAPTAFDPEPPKFFLKLEGSLNYLAAEIEARTNKRRATITSWNYRPQHPAEAAALERLTRLGFAPNGPKGEWALRGETAVLTFFARDLPAFQKEWNTQLGTRFSNVTEGFERAQPQFEVRGSGQNWFEVGFSLATASGEGLSAAEARRLIASGKRSARLTNGRTLVFTEDMVEQFDELLRDTSPAQPQPGQYRFDQRDAGYLRAFAAETGSALTGQAKTGADWNAPLPFARPGPPPDLGPLDAQLRDYQRAGVHWLETLRKNNLNGLLADEMGLGKTVQTLAYLRDKPGPKLVACPASLTFNWQREAMHWTPELQPIQAADLTPRDLGEAVQSGRLVITSYGLLRRDADFHRSVDYAAIVLDEAQHIKNPDSQTAKAAHRLRAGTRLALTGTPVENGVRDIWSIMQFLMPGYLGERDWFRSRFEQPIQSQPGGPEHRRLVQRLSPFILRRTKRQVAKELPEKIIQLTECELAKAQKNLYKSLLQAARQALDEATTEKAAGAKKLAAFTALLRLRQICCDPRLVVPDGQYGAADSAKLDLLMELLGDAIADGHRVLVFSQFATMLGLIQSAVEQAGIPFCYLDGATKDRQAAVDRFQTGSVPVFLISLKAGGVGLNLTAADTVILYDPWWNPAVEAQAIDRAHRIGQARTVTVYKLIAAGTVEEKIAELQQRKREISDYLVDGEQPLMAGLTLEDMASLVQ